MSSCGQVGQRAKAEPHLELHVAGVDPLGGPPHLVAQGPGRPQIVGPPVRRFKADDGLSGGAALAGEGVRHLEDKGIRRIRAVLERVLQDEPRRPGTCGTHLHHPLAIPLAPLHHHVVSRPDVPFFQEEPVDGDGVHAVSRKVRHPGRPGHPVRQELILQGIVRRQPGSRQAQEQEHEKDAKPQHPPGRTPVLLPDLPESPGAAAVVLASDGRRAGGGRLPGRG